MKIVLLSLFLITDYLSIANDFTVSPKDTESRKALNFAIGRCNKMFREKLHIVISGANGDWESDFPSYQSVHAVKTAAMAYLHMDPSQANQFVLTINGVTLDESENLVELGILNGSMLVLEKTEVVNIAN